MSTSFLVVSDCVIVHIAQLSHALRRRCDKSRLVVDESDCLNARVEVLSACTLRDLTELAGQVVEPLWAVDCRSNVDVDVRRGNYFGYTLFKVLDWSSNGLSFCCLC